MLLEIIISMLAGILVGTITGLTPGIHINLVGAFLISIFLPVNPIFLVVFIVALSITHTFIDFIPSIFLGCPDTTNELSVLPGHELLKQGKGYEAVLLTAYGGLIAIFIILLFSFPAVLGIEKIYNIINRHYIMSGVLILASLFLILSEKKKFSALLAFLLTGILGLCVLNLENSNLPLNQPLLPLLTGLFGASTIILSIKNKIKIPLQETSFSFSIKENKKQLAKAFLGSLVAIPLSSFIPAIGSGQSSVIGSQITRIGDDRKAFLVLTGAVNTLIMGFSFLTFYTISKTRTGSAVVVKELLGNFSWNILILILLVIFLSGIISFFAAKFLAKFFSKRIEKINYSLLSYITLGILVIVVFLVSGFFGLAVLAISTLTGIYCISLNVRRTQMMGCLLLSTIIFYLM